MPSGPRLLLERACYHILARGNGKQKVFLEQNDFLVCIKKLREYKQEHGFLLYGYCLMPNHIHLIGEPIVPENLSKFMHAFLRSYTAYFNNRYARVGHLWQGRFKSKVINKDGYLINCVNYIEFNPLRAGLVKSAAEYQWSSYKERVFYRVDTLPMLDQFSM